MKVRGFDFAKTILCSMREGGELNLRYGFDPTHPTCYKCPFCSGMPELESYFSSLLFKGVAEVQSWRKIRRGQAQPAFQVLRWKRVRKFQKTRL
jgi:hypothetical protein